MTRVWHLRRMLLALLAPMLVVVGCGDDDTAAEPLSVRVVTFNTGAGAGGRADPATNGGYGPAQAAIADEWYGNGLAWLVAIDDTRRFFAAIAPDVVAFQEIFHPEDCAAIPAAARDGFVCEAWQSGGQSGAPTVVQQVVGAGYQVACNLGKPDKCLAVRRGFGTIRGCEGDLCLDGLAGAEVTGCGRGSRVGRAVIELRSGGELTVVNVHGTSGFTAADVNCRIAQFAQIFADLGTGDGAPAAQGERVVVLGDFNTDPVRTARLDGSARELAAATTPPSRFSFASEVGEQATPTYLGAFNIDHVITAGLSGDCWAAGVSAGRAPVTPLVYFDHTAIVCDLVAARQAE